MQDIANNRYIIAKSYFLIVGNKKGNQGNSLDMWFKWLGRQDSNLRPSAPKAPATQNKPRETSEAIAIN